ncbi:MAG: hypothetical protein H6741_25965 [Alphaproteobacteria bacterium]|nr:hypothetical protein [Alphaproteobacteria bacterium]
MRVELSVAERQSDVLRCQYFIAEIYNRHYDILFSEDMHDLEARIEPYPHRYLMARVEGELVAALGLYERDTYVQRYGGVLSEEIDAQLEAAGVAERYAGWVQRELTKMVVKPGWGSLGLARAVHEISHSPDFMSAGTDAPVLLTVCGKVSFLDRMFQPRGRIGSRFLAPFPRYPMHDAYRSSEDPMESRLIIPALDVPRDLLEARLPREVELPGEPPTEAR